jgi:type II secretory pathway pseudopilin PulG
MTNKSFTLLELIVILIILLILTAFAVAKLNNIAEKSAGITEEAIVASLRGAVNLYYARNFSWPDWPDSGNPFSLLKYAPANWSFMRHEDSNSKYWWIRCPHNKIWWIYTLSPCEIHRDCSEDIGKIYPAGKVIRCRKTPITHDYIAQ